MCIKPTSQMAMKLKNILAQMKSYSKPGTTIKPKNNAQTTLSKYFRKIINKDNVQIIWTIVHKTNKEELKKKICI